MILFIDSIMVNNTHEETKDDPRDRVLSCSAIVTNLVTAEKKTFPGGRVYGLVGGWINWEESQFITA